MSSIPSIPLSPALIAGDSSPPPTRHTFQFNGEGWSFFTLMLKHIFLNIITLGIYLPWAKSEKRSYLWQNIEIAGAPLRYHGTGKELFWGYVKVVAAWLGYVGLITATATFSPFAGLITQFVLGFAIIAVIPGIILGSRAYLLTRTSWRGVFFGVENAKLFSDFTKLWLEGYLVTLFTFGLYAPVWNNRIYSYLTNNTLYGDTSLEYLGDTYKVTGIFFRSLPLILLTGGLYYFWYAAKLWKYQLSVTYFQNATGKFDITGSQLLWLFLVQVLGTTLTLGLALPWVSTYTFSFIMQRISFEGEIDFTTINQGSQTIEGAADSFADVLDIGIGL